jgi:hypothetical protein
VAYKLSGRGGLAFPLSGGLVGDRLSWVGALDSQEKGLFRDCVKLDAMDEAVGIASLELVAVSFKLDWL